MPRKKAEKPQPVSVPTDWEEKISPQHLAEWQASGVSEELIRLNVVSLAGDDALDAVIGHALAKLGGHANQYDTKEVQRLKLKYAHVANGGWWCQGIDPTKDWAVLDWGQFKPDCPREDPAKPEKVVKYETPLKVSASAIVLRHPHADFWTKVVADPSIPLVICEGAKKTGFLMSLGFAAIGLPGVNMGVRKDDAAGRLLIPALQAFAQPGRPWIIAFDQDTKANTVNEVDRAKRSLTNAIGMAGGTVRWTRWDPLMGKGIDDVGQQCGLAIAKKIIETAQAWEDPKAEESKKSGADLLVEVALERLQLWSTEGDDGDCYADLIEGPVRKTFALKGRAFDRWLRSVWFKKTQKSLGPDAVSQAIATLEAQAIDGGVTRDIALRVAASPDGKVYLDLGRDDWSIVEVTPDGWQLVTGPPVRFRRAAAMLPLPIPERGGNLSELMQFLGLGPETGPLVCAYLLACLRPSAAYPVLILHGEAGSGKSTLSNMLKALIDPGKAGLLASVGDLRNLAISANNRHIVAYDNLSGMSGDQSDALCRISTGGGFSHRTLHTDSDETVLEFVKPQLLNGIDSIATRGDLLDRSLLIKVQPPAQREDASWIKFLFEKNHGRYLGALLDALSLALRQLPSIPQAQPVRMIEFARLAIAAESALGLAPGGFLSLYQGNRAEAAEAVMDSNPVAQAILDLMRETSGWRGTARELLTRLRQLVDEGALKSKYWPADETRLSKELKRLSPDLRKCGVDFDSKKEGRERKRIIVLSKSRELASAASAASATPVIEEF
jgi:energy-coupling factor transporter ATP-binding protein EcfA2